MIKALLFLAILYPLGMKWFEWTIKCKGTVFFYPMALVMVPLDILFNLTWGSVLFRELPKEFLFTTRVKRHYRTCAFDEYDNPIPRTDQQFEAVEWAEWLNKRDPRHVTRGPK